MTKQDIIDKVIDYQEAWDGYLEKSWENIKYIYAKTKGAGYDNVVWPWHAAVEIGLPNLQGSYWCAIWQFMSYVCSIGLEKTQKLFHQTWFINCQSLYETFKTLEKSKNKTFVYTTPAKGRIYLHWNGSRHNHTENVIKVSSDGKYFWTNGGNTSVSGAVANGGGIYHMKKYTTATCKANGDHFIELDWDNIGANKIDLETYDISVGELGLTISVDNTLNVRDYPKTGEVVSSVKNGERVFPTKKAFIMGEPWYYIPDKKGWISAKYIDGGWVHENSVTSNYKWWYIHKGYTCTVSDIEIINGTKYLFDEEGYMVENAEVVFKIGQDGAMIFDGFVKE